MSALVVGIVNGLAACWVLLSILWGIASYDPDPQERPRWWPWIALLFPAFMLFLLGMVAWSWLMWKLTPADE